MLGSLNSLSESYECLWFCIYIDIIVTFSIIKSLYIFDNNFIPNAAGVFRVLILDLLWVFQKINDYWIDKNPAIL